MKVMVTGAAGFIGAATCQALLDHGDEVIGIDNLNDYYDPQLKKDRLSQFNNHPNFRFEKMDITEFASVDELFSDVRPDKVIHFAAQPGVRYSLVNPHPYIETNISGFFNIVENCKTHEVQHLLYASSSSVYGANKKIPYSVDDNVDNPVSLYAASKKSNELMAHAYSAIYKLPTTGLRFFTVYGPWGRPDMTPSLFVKKMLANEEIEVFNQGNHSRDYTYIDDVVDGILKALAKEPDTVVCDESTETNGCIPYRIYNVGNHSPVKLEDMLDRLEKLTGNTCKKRYLPMQLGDVADTYADISTAEQELGFSPLTDIDTGLKKYMQWHREYYG